MATTPGGSATPAVDRTAGSILDLAKACASKFNKASTSQTTPSSKERLGNRLADFSLWADGVGATAKPGLSLDSRLRSRPSDLAIVKNILLMLSDSLDHLADLSEKGQNTDDGIQNVDSAIRNLALVGVAIRRTGKASRSRKADRTFDPDEHQELRKHLECVLLLRPTEKGRHSEELDPSTLSALQRRLIDANLRRRHQFLLAQRRSRDQKKAHRHHPAALEVQPSVDDTLGKDERPVYSRNPEGGSRDHPPMPSAKGKGPLLAPSISGLSRASTAEGTLKFAPNKPYTPKATKTQITLIASDAEFPEPPVIPEDRKIFQCPCCCQSLQVETFKDPKLWKQHIVEDLCPYTCIAEDCPTPQLLFCTRREWEVHVKKSHLPRWQCPFCDDEDDAKQPSMEAMTIHLQSDHRNELSDNSLSTLLSWSAVQTMGIKTCPFCSDYAPEDAPDLVDHVLREAYGFALRALPWPKPVDHDLNKHPGAFKLPDKGDDESPLGRWIRETAPEDENAVGLKLCHYDRADHSEPISLDEYTDYFDDCGYFAEAESDDTANRKTLASASTQTTEASEGWSEVDFNTCLQTLEGHDFRVCFGMRRRALASRRLKGMTVGLNRWPFHNDRQLASTSDDETVKLWDTATGACIATFIGHIKRVWSVAFSHNDRQLASASADETVKLWDTATGVCVTTLKGHTHEVNSVAFSYNGRQLASASDDRTIKLWGERVLPPPEHSFIMQHKNENRSPIDGAQNEADQETAGAALNQSKTHADGHKALQSDTPATEPNAGNRSSIDDAQNEADQETAEAAVIQSKTHADGHKALQSDTPATEPNAGNRKSKSEEKPALPLLHPHLIFSLYSVAGVPHQAPNPIPLSQISPELLARSLELAPANGKTDVSWSRSKSFGAVDLKAHTLGGAFRASRRCGPSPAWTR
ncbi:hypothetical protein MAPG_10821 [Magnaporthiopsis poae ATCC 64411]|uniref:Uncharacterized protein n=1 Tax=Magnaporthiopsis poae (strain ATCC 64411 / 73-15) TaxID=644358 RepID=A0A0C4EDL7_MAGP6|nr:hypothetical protein MAPG_10821 [Magnaporthiopsis poae ATCC 64411]